MNRLCNIFSPQPFIIGMVHFGPLVGRPGAPSSQMIAAKARADLKILLRGNVTAVMFENMYDQPHTERLDAARVREFDSLLKTLTRNLKIPFGLSLLWNDYPNAFRLALKYGATWIRVPVFVDSVKTNYGTFLAKPKDVVKTRLRLGATKVAIMTDVQVKHATILQPRSIAASAKATVRAGADAVIVTGKWTGEPPTFSDLRQVRRTVDRTPVFIGSGLTVANVKSYRSLIDGAIVGTAFKRGGASPTTKFAMRAPWQRPLALTRVRQFMRVIAK